MGVVRSELMEVVSLEELGVKVLSKSFTRLNDCAAAVGSLVSAGEAVFFKSPRTVANADCAVDKSPEVSALPSAARSVAYWELLDKVVPAVVAEFWEIFCSV